MSLDDELEERHRQFYREVSADRLRDWVLKPENDHLWAEIQAIYGSYPDMADPKRTAVKGLLLKELVGLQGVPSRMELAMILIQLGLISLDWGRLEDDLGITGEPVVPVPKE